MGAPLQIQLSGKVIGGGRFRVERREGMTYQGTLFAAIDRERGDALVAVTAFSSSQLEDSAERLVLLGFTHPRVVPIFAAGVDEGHAWFARGALAERFLSDELAANRLSLGRALSIVAAVCDGVAALHAAGLVHGALLPQNVYVGYPKSARDLASDEVRVVDPLLPGVTHYQPRTQEADLEACVKLVETLLEEREVAPAIAALVKERHASVAALGAACTERLGALTVEERDAIPPRPPPPPAPPVDVPMPTNWSPPPPRQPFAYVELDAPMPPTNWFGPPQPPPPQPPTNWFRPPAPRTSSKRGLLLAVAAIVAAAVAALVWSLLRR